MVISQNAAPIIVDVGEFEIGVNLVINERDARRKAACTTSPRRHPGRGGGIPPANMSRSRGGYRVGILKHLPRSSTVLTTSGRQGPGSGFIRFTDLPIRPVDRKSRASSGRAQITISALRARFGRRRGDGADGRQADVERAAGRRYPEVATRVRVVGSGYTAALGAERGGGAEGIEKDGIDVVFSDIVMPGRLDGLGLARTIKQKRPDLPILLATGYSEAAQNAGGDFSILRKPYQMHELSRALAELTGD